MKFKYLFFLVLFSSHVFADVETEDNGSKETANPLSPGVPMDAQLSGLKDRDWFSANISGPGTLEINFQHEEGFVVLNNWTVETFDSKDTLLSNKQISLMEEETIIKVGIPSAGTYFIQVSPGDDTKSGVFDTFLTDPYTITASFSEGEPNQGDTENCRASFQDGILTVPCIDIPTGDGESIEYEAELTLVPSSGPLLFEVTDAQPK